MSEYWCTEIRVLSQDGFVPTTEEIGHWVKQIEGDLLKKGLSPGGAVSWTKYGVPSIEELDGVKK